jgi:ankyrin repeat protein
MNYEALYPLHDAVGKADIEEVRRLIAKGYEVDKKTEYDDTPLLNAIIQDNIEIVEILLEAKADPNFCASVAQILPLGWAAWKGKFEIVQCLLRYGADPSLQSGALAYTPFMGAAENGHVLVVNILLPYIEPDHKQEFIEFAFWAAISKGYHEVIDVILPHIEDPNILNENEQTALHQLVLQSLSYSEDRHYFESIRSLLNHPMINPYSKNAASETAFEYGINHFIEHPSDETMYLNLKRLIRILILHDIQLDKSKLYRADEREKDRCSIVNMNLQTTHHFIQAFQERYKLPHLKIAKAILNFGHSHYQKMMLFHLCSVDPKETQNNSYIDSFTIAENHQTTLIKLKTILLDLISGKGSSINLPVEIRIMIVERMMNMFHPMTNRQSFDAYLSLSKALND